MLIDLFSSLYSFKMTLHGEKTHSVNILRAEFQVSKSCKGVVRPLISQQASPPNEKVLTVMSLNFGGNHFWSQQAFFFLPEPHLLIVPKNVLSAFGKFSLRLKHVFTADLLSLHSIKNYCALAALHLHLCYVACVHLCSTCVLLIEVDHIHRPVRLYFPTENNALFRPLRHKI